MKVVRKVLQVLLLIMMVLFVGVFSYLFFPSAQKPILFDYGTWKNGQVKHILPQFNHEKLLLKVSFENDFKVKPKLWINNEMLVGDSPDSRGKFWTFYKKGLAPNTQYHLQLKTPGGVAITDPWKITTFPHPDSSASNLKILKYTCAGGISESIFGKEIFLDMSYRRALLKRALKENPRIVIANGDHVYWDQKTSSKSLIQKIVKFRRERMYGKLDLNKSMLDESNFEIFTSIIDDQITELYGCLLREKSVYFVTDDHDLFENDDAIKEKGIISFPAKDYMLDAVSATTKLYYPTLNSGKEITIPDISFAGGFQYGDLVAANIFDAKSNMTLGVGSSAVLVDTLIEKEIIRKTKDTSFQWHLVAPSSPFAWSAGKWLEWYPDILDREELVINKEKYLWQSGWWDQHQRFLKAFAERSVPSIILQGDLHMASYGKILKSQDLNFEKNPIHVITTAPLGSGAMAFPSSFRGIGAQVPKRMSVEEIFPPTERNGFTILNISQSEIYFDIFTWRLPETMADIDQLIPTFSSTIRR